ncbi:MAG: sigma 54-interacting transcriptional regulator [Candidatus Scalindua sp.]|nr:sigma 54-interacting transcriptional regulator [Candidatus Scalindua sp.]
MQKPKTVKELRESGYKVVSVKDEMRSNLIVKLRQHTPLFPGIVGYDDTVLPQIENAILSRHDILLLGLRGQAKTRILRSLIHLLDEEIPVIKGCEINDNPFHPVCKACQERVNEHGEYTEIAWLLREERYREKLATPDVTVADLIGEIDLVKVAEGKYLSNESTMHFGLIPRTNRGILAINELPDLSQKIQVSLFNVLEERDIQIRGYPVRLSLDVMIVCSANPEDYTNRGRIVTPLKDRIGSVVTTHYPLTREDGIMIIEQNAWIDRQDGIKVTVPKYIKEITEEISHIARASQEINQSSGVSARMSICNYETLISNSERRAIQMGETCAVPRISDLRHIFTSSRGKIEFDPTIEENQDEEVLRTISREAVKKVFNQYLNVDEYQEEIKMLNNKTFLVSDEMPSDPYVKIMSEDKEVSKMVDALQNKMNDIPVEKEIMPPMYASLIEFLLEGLHANRKLNKDICANKTVYTRKRIEI